MRTRLLNWLCSPCCGQTLSLRVFAEEKERRQAPPGNHPFWRFHASGVWDETWSREITDGLLTCACGRTYPITGGIPRFGKIGPNPEPARPGTLATPLPAHPAASLTEACYGSLWKFKSREIGWEVRSHEEQTWFLSNMGLNAGDLAGKTMVDAGCGDGRLTSAVSSLAVEAIGIDLSTGVDIGYAKSTSPLVHYVQGDILRPPIRRASCDFVWSFGVLHHTRDTRSAFQRCVELLRPGGRMFVWLYDSAPRRRSVLIRATQRAPLTVKWLVSGGLALGNLAKKTFGRGNPVTYSQSLAEVFFWNLDMYGPEFRHLHSVSDVTQWFDECGFKNVTPKARMEFGFGLVADLQRPHRLGEHGSRLRQPDDHGHISPAPGVARVEQYS